MQNLYPTNPFDNIPLRLFHLGTLILLAAKPTVIAHNRGMLSPTKPLIALAAVILLAAKTTVVANSPRDFSAADPFSANAAIVLLTPKPTVIAQRRRKRSTPQLLIAPATRLLLGPNLCRLNFCLQGGVLLCSLFVGSLSLLIKSSLDLKKVRVCSQTNFDVVSSSFVLVPIGDDFCKRFLAGFGWLFEFLYCKIYEKWPKNYNAE